MCSSDLMGVPPAAEEHEARAHVQLPPPPEGGLQTIDDLDASIQSLEAQVQAQAANTGEARAAASSAQANAAQLGQLHQQVENRGDTADARQADAQRVSQQNAEARQRTDAQNGSAAQGVERVKTPLEQIAGPARFVNGIIQRVPSNRFINVDGPKRSLAQFVQAIDTITGHGQQQGEQRQQAQTVLQQRDATVQQAGQQRTQNTAATQQMAQKVATDHTATVAVAQDATQQAQASRQAERTLAQQLQQKRAERQQKWGALAGWAQHHHEMREAAMAGGGHGE